MYHFCPVSSKFFWRIYFWRIRLFFRNNQPLEYEHDNRIQKIIEHTELNFEGSGFYQKYLSIDVHNGACFRSSSISHYVSDRAAVLKSRPVRFYSLTIPEIPFFRRFGGILCDDYHNWTELMNHIIDNHKGWKWHEPV